jgi:hypothetical protein
MSIRIAFLVFVAGFLIPSGVLAQTTTSPAVNYAENLQCWTKEACVNDWDGDGKEDGRWATDKEEKSNEECGGSQYRFCYPPKENLDLNVSIPTGGKIKTSVTDLGDYVGAFYNYLVGVAATIATVMIIVSGAQYVAAAGSGEVGKAKERIKNAVTGFVILLFAVVLLFTVNPQLVKLEVPSVPRVRQVVFFGDETTCEFYLSKGYTVTDSDGSEYAISSGETFVPEAGEVWCGLPDATVTADPQGNPMSEETPCVWSWCGGFVESITSVAGDMKGEKKCQEVSGKRQCVGCWEATTDNPLGVTPNSGQCGYLTPEVAEDNVAQKYQCLHSRDNGFEPSETFDSTWEGLCALVAYDCTKITTCDGYDSIIAWNDDGKQLLPSFEDSTLLYSYHESICESNPCNVSGGCKQDLSLVETALATYVNNATLGFTEWLNAGLGTSETGIECVSKISQ